MKNDFLEKGIKALQEIRLSPKDKEAVLARLLDHIEKNPPIVSPVQVYVSRFNFKYVMAGLLVMVLTGGSVTSSAEAALPGDVLYPIKVNVTEPVRAVFLASDAAKAQWEETRTVRRLQEAQSLAAEGRLDTAAVRTVTDHFKKSANEFSAIVQKSESKGRSAEALEARQQFAAQISAHSQILATVENNATTVAAADTAETRVAPTTTLMSAAVAEETVAAPLMNAINEELEKARGERLNSVKTLLNDIEQGNVPDSQAADESRVLSATTTDSTDAERIRKLFDAKTQSIEAFINQTEVRLAELAPIASSTAQSDILESVTRLLQTADEYLLQAKVHLDSGNAENAFVTLLAAEAAAKEAFISLVQSVKWGVKKNTQSQKNEKLEATTTPVLGEQSAVQTGFEQVERGRRQGVSTDKK